MEASVKGRCLVHLEYDYLSYTEATLRVAAVDFDGYGIDIPHNSD